MFFKSAKLIIGEPQVNISASSQVNRRKRAGTIEAKPTGGALAAV